MNVSDKNFQKKKSFLIKKSLDMPNMKRTCNVTHVMWQLTTMDPPKRFYAYNKDFLGVVPTKTLFAF